LPFSDDSGISPNPVAATSDFRILDEKVGMAHRIWNFSLQRKNHEVQMDHSPFLGRMRIYQDGVLVKQITNLLDMGGEYSLDVKNHSCAVMVRPRGNLYDYDLAVDGISVTTGRPADRFIPLPRWRWIFIIACWFIPVISLGGIVPLLLGVGGAFACSSIVKTTSMKVGLRVSLCLVTTSLVWVAFLGFGIWSSFQRLGIKPF
jgi:hypothetical protein